MSSTPAAMVRSDTARNHWVMTKLYGSGAVDVYVQLLSAAHSFMTGNISRITTKAENMMMPAVATNAPASENKPPEVGNDPAYLSAPDILCSTVLWHPG